MEKRCQRVRVGWSNGERMVCYRGGLFNGGTMIVREVVSFIEVERSFYRGAQFNGGRIVIL